MIIRHKSWKTVQRDKRLFERLKQLTNVGGGDHLASGMIEWMQMRAIERVWLLYEYEEVQAWSCLNSRDELSVYVHKDFRQRGFATALVARTCKYAKRRGIQLLAGPWTDAGRSLYTKLGFVQHDAIPGIACDPDSHSTWIYPLDTR